MPEGELVKLLEKAASLSEGNTIQKLLKAPDRLLISAFLGMITSIFGHSIRMRTKTFWAEKMTIIIPEIVSSNIFRYRFFEEGLSKMILYYLRPGMVFFDVGSHYGYYTMLASHILRGSGRVFAFEPTPSSFKVLSINTERRSNVTLNNLAIASKKKTLVMNDYGVKYSAWNSVYSARLPRDVISNAKSKKYAVSAISIDEYVKEYCVEPDFIKIDAESCEFEIILGTKCTIERYRPIITIEVGDFGIAGVPNSRVLVEFLKDRGYESYEYRDGDFLPHETSETYKYQNILFLPK